MTLTRADWDANLLRIPADQRSAFASSAQRVQSEVNSLVVSKTLAARARQQGLQDDPQIQRRAAIEVDKILAAAFLEKVAGDALAEFDSRPDVNRARARELYRVDAKRYVVGEEVTASHILFSVDKRTREGALAAANEARAKLLAGADFATMARELSDDPSAKSNSGRLGSFARGRMDKAFEAAAFAQTKVGEISEPVLTKFGYHLIRHEGHIAGRQLTFDEVEKQILQEMRQSYAQRAREDAVVRIRTDPKNVVNQQALDDLVVSVPAVIPPVAPASSSRAKPRSGSMPPSTADPSLPAKPRSGSMPPSTADPSLPAKPGS